MVHGVRKGVARGVSCPGGKGMCFTSVRAAEAAVLRLKAERWYTCDQCGYMHITRYTLSEFNQRKALEGCTNDDDRGIVVSSTTEGVTREGQDEHPSHRSAGSESGGDVGGSCAPSLERGSTARPTPTPAEVARCVEARRNRGAVR